MIYNLCNQGNEQNDTFHSISVIKKSSLALFNHLTADATIQSIITSLAESSEAIILDLLPENVSLTATTGKDDNGKFYNVNNGFTLTPLDKNLQTLLEQYNNQEVVVLLKKNTSTFLYGTTTSPLLFTYNELHDSTAQGLKGYSISLRGKCLGASKQFEVLEFDIFNRGLAFDLAGSL